MSVVVNKSTHIPTANDVHIGRGSKWGNPYSHKDGTKAIYKVKNRKEAIQKYREYITIGDGRHLLNSLHELRGKNLVCFCKPKQCHGDVLLDILESPQL
jgi:hypothetical protein